MTPLLSPGWDVMAALHVCRHLRARDVVEVFAARAEVDGLALFGDLVLQRGQLVWFETVRAAFWDPPIAIMGVMAKTPGVGSAFLLGTPQFGVAEARFVAASVAARMPEGMAQAGLHRVECLSLASYRAAHRFLRRCGAEPEGLRRAIGKNREDFIEFAWVATEPEEMPCA